MLFALFQLALLHIFSSSAPSWSAFAPYSQLSTSADCYAALPDGPATLSDLDATVPFSSEMKMTIMNEFTEPMSSLSISEALGDVLFTASSTHRLCLAVARTVYTRGLFADKVMGKLFYHCCTYFF